MLRATLKSLMARKLRLLLSGLAVVLGVMFVSGAFVLTDTLSRSYEAVFDDAYSTIDVSVTAKSNLDAGEFEDIEVQPPFPADIVQTVREVPGVGHAYGAVTANGAKLIGTNGKVVTSFGPPQLGSNWISENELIKLREGRGPTADDEIAINAGLAKSARVGVGDRVGVLTPKEPKREFTVVGIWGYSGGRDSLGGEQEIAFTEPVAQQVMLGQTGVYNTIVIEVADGVDPDDLRDDVAAHLGDGYIVKTGEQLSKDASKGLTEGLSFFNNILLGFAGVALFVGVFLILNTFSIIVAQRTRELALLRAIGASRRQMIGSVLVEAAVVGLLASVLGLGAGIGVGALLAYVFGQFSGGLDLAGITVPPAAVISAFVVGLVVTVIAATLPAIRASRIPPMAAMQDVSIPDRPLTKLSVAGSVVTAAGAALLAAGLTDNAADQTLWAILGGVLLSFVGVALLTPLISRPVVSLLGRPFSWSVPGKLGRLNSGRNPRRTAITAAALMVGIALVTGVTVILDSTKSSIDERFDKTVKADLVISGVWTGPQPPTFDPAALEKIAALPGVKTVAGLYVDQALVGKERTFVVATNSLPAVRDILQAKPVAGSLDSLGPNQLVVDEDTATKHGLSVGSTVPVQLINSDAKTYTVTGIYAKVDLFSGYVLPIEATADFVVPRPAEAYLQLTPGTSSDDVLPQVEALLVDSPEVSVADRQAYVDQQLSQLDQLLTMIQMLLVLAILIAVLGIVNTLALSVLERTRELGLLRAIGLRRAQTMRMITVEAVVISVFGALLGVAVGTGLGAAVVRALREQGITNLVLPWTEMGVFLAVAALVGVIAAVLPAIRAARLNVLGAIAHE